MQKCKVCSNKFGWKSIIKSAWFYRYDKPMICGKCKTEHYINLTSRLVTILSYMILLLIPIYFEGINKKHFVAFFIVWVIIMALITPFYAKFHMGEKNNENVN